MSPPPRVVLLAPDPAVQRRVQMALGQHGILVAAAASPGDARRLMKLERPAALVVDARRDDVRDFATSQPEGGPSLFGLIDPSDGKTASDLLSGGADEIVPITLIEPLLMHRLRDALERAERSSSKPPRRRTSNLLVGRSPAMVEAVGRIEVIAKSDMGASIFGETGTGKELAARTIHLRSRRATKPLVVANCTALPEALFENELFGHERGAFTGADSRREGLLAEAEGGTLLLDEIGDIAPGVQAKLLRLLQFHEYKMVGGTKTLKADVRILTSTHRDLAAEVAAGRFREDLFYRLNTLHLELPALRERLEDIPLLVDHFVSSFNEREGRSCAGFTPAAIRAMQRHDWPGNVRELESVVYRSLVIAGHEDKLDAPELDIHRSIPPAARSMAPREDVSDIDMSVPFADLKADVLERFERRYLERILERTRGNLSRAAREAQHERKSLWRLVNKYEIDPKTFKKRGSSQSGSK